MKGQIGTVIGSIVGGIILVWLFVFILGPAFSTIDSELGVVFVVAGIVIIFSIIAVILKTVIR